MYFYNSHQFRSHQVKVKPAKCGARSLPHLSMTWETCWMHQVSLSLWVVIVKNPLNKPKKKSCFLLNPGLRLIAKLQQVWAQVFTGDSVFFLCLVYSIHLTFFFKFRQSVKYFNI